MSATNMGLMLAILTYLSQICLSVTCSAPNERSTSATQPRRNSYFCVGLWRTWAGHRRFGAETCLDRAEAIPRPSRPHRRLLRTGYILLFNINSDRGRWHRFDDLHRGARRDVQTTDRAFAALCRRRSAHCCRDFRMGTPPYVATTTALRSQPARAELQRRAHLVRGTRENFDNAPLG
jgi:hypothetical protein